MGRCQKNPETFLAIVSVFIKICLLIGTNKIKIGTCPVFVHAMLQDTIDGNGCDKKNIFLSKYIETSFCVFFLLIERVQ